MLCVVVLVFKIEPPFSLLLNYCSEEAATKHTK